ncbi:MAG: pesticin C-terminus-like muramidase, partial [Bacteroidota bacterium]
GKAIVKVKLRKKSDEDYKKQQEALKDDKQARLFLKVTCQGDDKKHKIAFVQQMMLITETRGYIDWDFIGKREGKGILNGYVPSKTTTEKIPKKDEKGEIIKVDGNIQFENVEKKIAIGRSGVTIATGFDIGQQNAYGIKKIFKSEPELISKYLPYVDKIKEDAISFLENNPLSITKEQAQKTDELIKEDQKNTVIRKYNSYDMPYKFESQPTGIQTVVMSVSFQYGAYSKHLTDMWKALQEDNVSDLIKFFESQTQYKNAEVKRLNS